MSLPTMSLRIAIGDLNLEINHAYELLSSMRKSFRFRMSNLNFKSEKTCQIQEKMNAQTDILLGDLCDLENELRRLASERKQSEVEQFQE